VLELGRLGFCPDFRRPTPGERGAKLVFVAFPGEMVKLAGTALRTAINKTLTHQPQDGSEHPAPAQHAYRPRDSGVVLQHA